METSLDTESVQGSCLCYGAKAKRYKVIMNSFAFAPPRTSKMEEDEPVAYIPKYISHQAHSIADDRYKLTLSISLCKMYKH